MWQDIHQRRVNCSCNDIRLDSESKNAKQSKQSDMKEPSSCSLDSIHKICQFPPHGKGSP